MDNNSPPKSGTLGGLISRNIDKMADRIGGAMDTAANVVDMSGTAVKGVGELAVADAGRVAGLVGAGINKAKEFATTHPDAMRTGGAMIKGAVQGGLSGGAMGAVKGGGSSLIEHMADRGIQDYFTSSQARARARAFNPQVHATSSGAYNTQGISPFSQNRSNLIRIYAALPAMEKLKFKDFLQQQGVDKSMLQV